MNSLRYEFEKLQKSKFEGTELMFKTSNNEYIKWLENKLLSSNIIKNFQDEVCNHSSLWKIKSEILGTVCLKCRYKK